ncbi:F-box protein [Rickettsiales endosymbiont of Stachyamoeba lipophora]|uniref:F-box protein n=1 Tax=Rickettsiales endosymbiont of Stachyamoeba lipophora TaxID=2486578 RepID=UPI000F652E1E|nr:F-box protein [Rickettsiales endosymbiont of Stachyamoeba lipophora]AZL16422.1 F-box protein [Rickettsiales endosymbiont of Stachyamoeba lipophora]
MSNSSSSINAIDQESETGTTFPSHTTNPMDIPDEIFINIFQFLSFQELLALRGTNKQLSKLINTTIAHEITANVDARILPSLTDTQKIDLLHAKKLKFENCNLETLKEYFESSGRLTDHNSYLDQVIHQEHPFDPTAKQEVVFEDIELIKTRAEIYNPWEQFCTEFRESFTDQNKKQRNYKLSFTIKETLHLAWYERFLNNVSNNDPTTDEILRHTSKLTLDFPITLAQAKMVINKLKQVNPDCKLTIFNLIQQDDVINHALNEVDVSIIDEDLAKHIKVDSFAKAKPEVILGITFDFTHANIGDAKQKLTIFNNTNLHWKIILNNFTNIILFNDSHLLSTELNPANFPNIEFIIDTDGSNDIVTANNFVQQINTIATDVHNLNLNLASYDSPYNVSKVICLDDFNSCKAYYKMLNQKHFYPKVKLTAISDYRVVINQLNNIEPQSNVGKYLAGISKKVRNFTLTSLNASEVSSRQLNDILINIACIESFILDATDQNIALEDLYRSLIKRQEKGLITQKIILKNITPELHSKYKNIITALILNHPNIKTIKFEENCNFSTFELLRLAKACWLTDKKIEFNNGSFIFTLIRNLPSLIDITILLIPFSLAVASILVIASSIGLCAFEGFRSIIKTTIAFHTKNSLSIYQPKVILKFFANDFKEGTYNIFGIELANSNLFHFIKEAAYIAINGVRTLSILFYLPCLAEYIKACSTSRDEVLRSLYPPDPQYANIPFTDIQFDMRNLLLTRNIYKAYCGATMLANKTYKACGNFTRKLIGEKQAEQLQNEVAR